MTIMFMYRHLFPWFNGRNAHVDYRIDLLTDTTQQRGRFSAIREIICSVEILFPIHFTA